MLRATSRAKNQVGVRLRTDASRQRCSRKRFKANRLSSAAAEALRQLMNQVTLGSHKSATLRSLKGADKRDPLGGVRDAQTSERAS